MGKFLKILDYNLIKGYVVMGNGASPVVATMLIVTVALAIGALFAVWVMGAWGVLGATEALWITHATLTPGCLGLYLVNRGTANTEIVSIAIENSTWAHPLQCKNANFPITIPTGSSSTFDCFSTDLDDVEPGKVYTVKVATLGGTYIYNVKAKGRAG